jgi:tetratricopeptide (TPR) repeat protein
MTSAQEYNHLGDEKYNRRKYEEAIEDYSAAIRIEPNNAVYFNNRGNSKRKLGRHEEAIEDYSEAIRINPSAAEYFNNRGRSKDELGRHEEAIEDYSAAIQINPNKATYFNNRGNSKHDLGRYEEAIEDYSAAIRIKPNKASYFNHRGLSKRQLGRYEEAIEDSVAAIQIDPSYTYAWMDIGLTKCLKGDWEGGLSNLNEAVQQKASEYSYFCLCFVLLRQGNIESAKTNLLQALKNNPNSVRLKVTELVINLLTSQNPSIENAIDTFHKHKQACRSELSLAVLVLSEKNYQLFEPLIAAMLEHLSIVFPHSIAVKDIAKIAKETDLSRTQKPSSSTKRISFLIEYKEEKVRMPETPISSLDDLIKKIRDRLKIGDNDARIEILDEEFDEYVKLDDFQLLQKEKHKLRVPSSESNRKREEQTVSFTEPTEKKQQEQLTETKTKTLASLSVKTQGEFANELGEKWEDLAQKLNIHPVGISPPNSSIAALSHKFVDELAKSEITLEKISTALKELNLSGLIRLFGDEKPRANDNPIPPFQASIPSSSAPVQAVKQAGSSEKGINVPLVQEFLKRSLSRFLFQGSHSFKFETC